jgi:hypothetical protein
MINNILYFCANNVELKAAGFRYVRCDIKTQAKLDTTIHLDYPVNVVTNSITYLVFYFGKSINSIKRTKI